jgi:DDE superfamily endonuclease
MLWTTWMKVVLELKPACTRVRTFFWMISFLIAITIRPELAGVTSCIRALGLNDYCYDRLLDFLHSPALNVEKLTQIWVCIVLRIFPKLLKVNGRLVLLGDGIKVAKEGRKMPAVKYLHQASDSNSKAEYIMGHSCQALSILVGAIGSFFAVPLTCRIHEGIVLSNRDKTTLLDKMVSLVASLNMQYACYLVVDNYYANQKMIQGMLNQRHHLVTRLQNKAVAYKSVPIPTGFRRGRPKKYGEKIKLKTLFDNIDAFQTIESPVYGEKNISIQYRVSQLYWRSAGMMVLIVHVIHPKRGRIMLMTTDLTLSPISLIIMYALRYKIEFSFKQALHVLGTYAYHFWMKAMMPLSRCSGDQHLHHKTEEYRDAVIHKISAYHRHIQLGLIAQGLLQYLACTMPETVWKKFGSWLRTIRQGIAPSEQVTALALRHSLPEFLVDASTHPIFKKFLIERIDFDRSDGINLAA